MRAILHYECKDVDEKIHKSFLSKSMKDSSHVLDGTALVSAEISVHPQSIKEFEHVLDFLVSMYIALESGKNILKEREECQ